MAHTADDVIDQHVNQCSKIPSVYMVYIFPSYEAGMRRKEAQKQKSVMNEKLEPSPVTDEISTVSRRIRSCLKKEST